MSENNVHLSAKCPSSESAVGQQTRSRHQPTYIIIYKQNETATTSDIVAANTENKTSDTIRRNLTDIDVDDYDSSFSTAKTFLGDEESNLTSTTVAQSQERNKLWKYVDANNPNVIKRNLFMSNVSSATSTCDAVKSVHSKISPILTPGNKNEQDSGVFCTPTSSENLKIHSAVRKIVLISPEGETPQRVQSLAARTLQACTSSPQLTPGFTVPRVPLVTSTPITTPRTHHDVVQTPDSGISLTTSFMCTTPNTPCATSVNLSTTSSPSVSSGFGRLQVSKKLLDNAKNAFQIAETNACTINPSGSINKAHEEKEDKCLDTSLANIQWLNGYCLSKKQTAPKPATIPGMQWMSENQACGIGSDAREVKGDDQSSGRDQRPPYSYMSLIQKALLSHEDKKMTLKEICSWVETSFPFYKYTAKAGWRNSIRHNLSFYPCFVRDKAEMKKHGAHWTLQFDEVENEQTDTTKSTEIYIPQPLTASEVPGMVPLFVNSPIFQQSFQPDTCNSRKRRTGPMPILPRPSPMQAYALVPIQSVPLHAMQNNPIIIHVPNTQQNDLSNQSPILSSAHTDSQTQSITFTSSLNSVHVNSQNQATSTLPLQLNSVYKQSQNMAITVTPKEYSIETSTMNYSKIQLNSVSPSQHEEPPGLADSNVIKQAWLQAEELSAVNETPFIQTSSNQMNRYHQMNHESGYHSDVIEQESKRQKINGGLPKPKMYVSRPRKKTRSRIKRQLSNVSDEKELLADSSDSESENKIISGLPTPLRLFFDSDNNATLNSEARVTSTPLRNVSFSPEQLLSPIHGLTPLKYGSLLDGSFLDNLHDEATKAIKLFGSPINCEPHKSSNNSFAEYGIVQISPDRGLRGQIDGDNKHNLSNLLADFPIDVNFMDDGDGLPVDFSVLNWSNLQQQCLNKSSPSDS